jgi:hypothetical protein
MAPIKRITVLVLMAAALYFSAALPFIHGHVYIGSQAAYAATDSSSKTTNNETSDTTGSEQANSSDESKGDESKGEDSGGLLAELKDICMAIICLPDRIATAVSTAIFNLTMNIYGIMIDSFLAIFCGVLASGFTNTVLPGSIDWVSSGNVTMWMLCTVLAVLFLVINIFHVIHGKKRFQPVLTSFALAVALSVFSVQVVNFMVWLVNQASTAIAQGALNGYSPVNVDVSTLTAGQIMSIPFQAPASFGTQVSFHSLFIDPVLFDNPQIQPHGGIIALLLAASSWMLIIILVMARILVICIGTILAPMYISMTAWSSLIEPAVGWLALMFRTVFLQAIWALGWQLMVFIQTAYSASNLSALFGACATALNIMILFVLFYVSYRYWLKPTVAQIAAPATLAGGVIIEKFGQAGEKIGRAVELVGMATLQPEVVAAGGMIGGAGKAAADMGQGMHGGRTLTESLDLSQNQPDMPAPGTGGVGKKIEQRYAKFQAELAEKEKKKYWTYGDKFVVRGKNGLPVKVVAPPEGYECQGEWQAS